MRDSGESEERVSVYSVEIGEGGGERERRGEAEEATPSPSPIGRLLTLAESWMHSSPQLFFFPPPPPSLPHHLLCSETLWDRRG